MPGSPTLSMPSLPVYCVAHVKSRSLSSLVAAYVLHMNRASDNNADMAQDPRRGLTAYNQCREAIAMACDNLIEVGGSRMRDRYYATILDNVMAVVLKNERDLRAIRLPTYEHANLETTCSNDPTISPVATPTSTCPMSGSEASETEFADAWSTNTLPTPPPTYTEHMQVDGPWGASLPEPSSNAPTGSSPSRPSPGSVNPVTSCQICQVTLLTTNLSRHLRTIHQREGDMPCPERGCDSTFTRLDNLDKHLRKVHAKVLLRRQGARKGRKVSRSITSPKTL